MSDIPIDDKISASFDRLSTAAAELNAASDELGRAIAPIEKVLQSLNIGVKSWVQIRRYTEPDRSFSTFELGYEKIGAKWGIALRIIQGYEHSPEEEEIQEWLFNEAPRWLRVEAIPILPDLLDGLVKEANRITGKIKAEVGHAARIASALENAVQAKAKAKIAETFKAQIVQAERIASAVRTGQTKEQTAAINAAMGAAQKRR